VRRGLIVCLCLAAACSPAVSVTRLAPTPAQTRSVDHPIAMFQAQLPRCAFDEVALVSVRPRTFWTKSDALADAMRASARELGGDAVIRVASEQTVEGVTPSADGSLDVDHGLVLSGTVVRFRDPSCKE